MSPTSGVADDTQIIPSSLFSVCHKTDPNQGARSDCRWCCLASHVSTAVLFIILTVKIGCSMQWYVTIFIQNTFKLPPLYQPRKTVHMSNNQQNTIINDN